jgi:hypothetical protein
MKKCGWVGLLLMVLAGCGTQAADNAAPATAAPSGSGGQPALAELNFEVHQEPG